MIRPPAFCLLALALAASPLALAKEAGVSASGDNEVDRSAATLDNFVQSAIDQGLLIPAGRASTGPAPGTRSLLPDTAAELRETAASPGAQLPSPPSLKPAQLPVNSDAPFETPSARVMVADTNCGVSDPYDFSDLAQMATYQDFMTWRGVLEADETPASATLLAKVYIALGLNEEARMQLDGKSGFTADALRGLSRLMGGRAPVELARFEHISGCYPEQGLWLSVAQIGQNNPAGADRFGDQINDFRELPFRLRVEVAMKIVPPLSASDQMFLSEKLLATFSEAEIQSTVRLQFLMAVQDLAMGKSGAEADLRKFYHRVELRDAAATVLRRHGYHVDPAFETEFVNRLVNSYGELPADIPVGASLDILLRDLNKSADYDMTLQLASLPAAQTPEAQTRLADHFGELVMTDLRSEETLKNLKAMDALLSAGDLLAGRDDSSDRFGEAAALAAHLGLNNLSAKLAARLDSSDDLALAQAELAYRLMDHDGLTALAGRHPSSSKIAYYAALDAIRLGDRDGFARVQARLPDDPETLVALIEADMASGKSVVTGQFYQAARSIEDETLAARATRALALRQAAQTGPPAPARITLADVSGSLDDIGRSLQPTIGGVN